MLLEQFSAVYMDYSVKATCVWASHNIFSQQE